MMTSPTIIANEILIKDSQMTRFSAFKERLNYCFCRLFGKASKFNLPTVDQPQITSQTPPIPENRRQSETSSTSSSTTTDDDDND